MKAQIRKINPFKVSVANELYNRMSNNSDVQEYGIDTNGKVYFHYLNGITKRFTRKKFIKMARSN